MKKYFVLFLMVVLVLGFAACEKQSKAGEPVSIVIHAPINELWRGVLTGRTEAFGQWALLEVENPKDNQDYQFKIMVVYTHPVGPAELALQEMVVDEEILFSVAYSTSQSYATPEFYSGTSCLGLFYDHIRGTTKQYLVDHVGRTVKNPPKK